MGRLNKLLDPTQTGLEAEKLESDLRKRIVGQNEAIDQIINIYQTHLAGMSCPGRPIGNFLFMGPTGSGKTRLVEAAAESLLGDARAVIKIDCAEFQHSHEIAKLIGSPPGYLGHRETHPLLSQEVLNQYHTERIKLSFVLFDEIEKASDALWNLLLGILDKATLTLGDNRRVDFSRALIFMTSNLGAAEMSSILRPSLGFGAGEIERRHASGVMDDKTGDKIARAGVDAARKKFSPEFMNRIDKTVVFKALGVAELRKILTLELNIVQQRIFTSANGAPFVFSLTDGAKDYLLREGTDLKYGARHLKRAIDRNLVHPLSNLIATEQVRGGDLIGVDFDEQNNRLTFSKEAEDMPAYAMVQMVDTSISPPIGTFTAGAVTEMPRSLNGKATRR
ncbi:MAG TPA: AAA family ATPase [Bryobacteraceae bacterium]|nr:AAA family ATPase [Bryobacteraceae bacterium]